MTQSRTPGLTRRTWREGSEVKLEETARNRNFQGFSAFSL
jgi:hypothetical protein